MGSNVAEIVTAAMERGGIRVSDGLQIVPVDALARRPFDPGMALLILPPGSGSDEASSAAPAANEVPVAADGFRPDVLPGRAAHGSDPIALLRRMYPNDHPVLGLGEAPDTTLAALTDADLGRVPLLLPPLAPEDWLASPHGLPWLAARLRAPDGCPWDREQDHLTLRKYLLEETYEVYDALERGSTPELAEELGDLLLQVVLHAQYGAEAGVFDLADVQRSIMSKIVRRHPHVFGDVLAGTAQEVTRNWEAIKETERAEAGSRDGGEAPGRGRETGGGASRSDPDMPGAFAGLSKALPSLAYAHEMQERAAGLGYDRPDVEGVIDKIEEEAVELLEAQDASARHDEFGDLLFVVVNLGRKLGIDPEAALRGASRKFASRFARVERLAADDGVQLRALGLDELDALWDRAKAEERNEAEDSDEASARDESAAREAPALDRVGSAPGGAS